MAIYAHRPRFSRLKERRCFHPPMHYTCERARTSPINWIATNTRCINELWIEREREEGKSGGWCRLLHPPLRFPSSHFLPPRRISASSLNRAHTNIHRYICILAGSFSASGSMRTSISASVYLQPFLEGFARSVSVFDHHSPPLCSTISRQQFNYLPLARGSLVFLARLISLSRVISSRTCSYCVDLL